MGWADLHIEKLKNGETVSFRPSGHSMSPRIKSRQKCTIEPITNELEVGDVVLCRVNGNQYLHLIKAMQGNRYQIGNNKGRVHGWITANSIYGKLTKVDD